MIPEFEFRRTKYGDLSPGRQDIRGQWSASIDLRPVTGGREWAGRQPEDRWLEPGTASLSLFTAPEGTHPVGEVRIIVRGVEVALVGELTGRPGVVEVTPDMLRGALGDNAYRVNLTGWMGLPEC